MLSGLRPLLAVLTDHLLPLCAPDALRHDILNCLQVAADQISEQPLTLRLHPDAVGPIASALSPTLGARVKLLPDDTVSPLAAHLHGTPGETLFDRQSLIEAIAALIAQLDTPETKEFDHG
ncbi:hypothetical protein [Loktanella sp. 3ANDIMAR09]|uniref:hypothetical protein n=1 Tax=Loktanella sp. 3ANDIMAR09 TaxID=1225657 RepID=UPI00155F34CB